VRKEKKKERSNKNIEGCIDDERQFKTGKRSQGLLVAFSISTNQNPHFWQI